MQAKSPLTIRSYDRSETVNQFELDNNYNISDTALCKSTGTILITLKINLNKSNAHRDQEFDNNLLLVYDLIHKKFKIWKFEVDLLDCKIAKSNNIFNINKNYKSCVYMLNRNCAMYKIDLESKEFNDLWYKKIKKLDHQR